MSLDDVIRALDLHHILVKIGADGQRRLASSHPTGMIDEAVMKAIGPHLAFHWEAFRDRMGANDSNHLRFERPDSLEMGNPKSWSPGRWRRHYYDVIVATAKLMESKIQSECSYNYEMPEKYRLYDPVMDANTLESLKQFPAHWTAVCVEKVQCDYPQIGGMMSGQEGVPRVRRAPIWTKLPGAIPPNVWKKPEPKIKKKNPWKHSAEDIRYRDQMPPD